MRERILKAASEEIKNKGTAFRMDDLAHELNISKRTLYEHFSSKREIVEVIINAKIEDTYEQHRQLLEDPDLSAEEKLAKYFLIRSRIYPLLTEYTLNEFFYKMPDLIDYVRESCQKDWDLLQTFMEEAKQDGFIKEYDTKILLTMLQGTLLELFSKKEDFKEYGTFNDVMKIVVDVLLNGIKKDGGRTIHE